MTDFPDPYPAFRNITWSPDGKSIAFSYSTDGELYEIFVYSFRDGALTQITESNESAYSAYDSRFCWSPDSSKIVFSAFLRDGSNKVLFMSDIGREEITQMTQYPGFDDLPLWVSNDLIVYFSLEMVQNRYVYFINGFDLMTNTHEKMAPALDFDLIYYYWFFH